MSTLAIYPQNSCKDQFQQGRWAIFPYESLYESLAEKFCSYTVHILKDAPPNILANNSLGLQVTYSPKGERQGSCFQQFIQRTASTKYTHHELPVPQIVYRLLSPWLSTAGGEAFLEDGTVAAFRESSRSESKFPILDAFQPLGFWVVSMNRAQGFLFTGATKQTISILLSCSFCN